MATLRASRMCKQSKSKLMEDRGTGSCLCEAIPTEGRFFFLTESSWCDWYRLEASSRRQTSAGCCCCWHSCFLLVLHSSWHNLWVIRTRIILVSPSPPKKTKPGAWIPREECEGKVAEATETTFKLPLAVVQKADFIWADTIWSAWDDATRC